MGFNSKQCAYNVRENCLYEVMNPIEGVPTSGVTKMAYDVLEVVALLCIEGKVHWQ